MTNDIENRCTYVYIYIYACLHAYTVYVYVHVIFTYTQYSNAEVNLIRAVQSFHLGHEMLAVSGQDRSVGTTVEGWTCLGQTLIISLRP